MPGVGQVNQKIARHTQNSAAQWNLNSARAVELNSLRNPAHSPRTPPSFPSLFPSLVASYSLSFVIRKQTERRSCQVGGVGDETAVSVRPSFFRLRRRPHGSLQSLLPPSPYRSPPTHTPHSALQPKSAITFSGVSTGHLTLFFDLVRLCGKSGPQKADSIIHCQMQAIATARYFAFFSCLPFFLRHSAISLKEREGERENKSNAKD